MSNELNENQIVEETIAPVLEPEVQTFQVEAIALQDSDEDDELEGESIGLGDYSSVEAKKDNIYLDPTTGETIDPETLTVAQKLKFIATSMGQTVNDPDPKCKKCWGRGYTGINPDGNIPHVCDCMYKEFYAQNPHWKNQQMPAWNRRAKRAHQKRMGSYVNAQMDIYRKHQAIVEKSKANLGKNTPGYVPKALREVEAPVEEVKEINE